MNYYNEIDPFAAQWLRNLIAAGHIAPGDVDERSIADVQPDDLAGYRQCHFFAGIGAWSYALRMAGWPDGRMVWTGSCPCQPFSAIGKQRGNDDERHLWPEFRRLIAACKPATVFGEQVAGALGLQWISGVRTDLETCGYAVGAADLCAAGVAAPHKRQRLYWVADSGVAGLERQSWDGGESDESGWFDQEQGGSVAEASAACPDSAGLDALHLLRGVHLHDPRGSRIGLRVSADRGVERVGDRSVWARFEHIACADGWRRVEPGTFPLAHGAPARVGRLRAYGNAIVPQVACEFVGAFLDTKYMTPIP